MERKNFVYPACCTSGVTEEGFYQGVWPLCVLQGLSFSAGCTFLMGWLESKRDNCPKQIPVGHATW